MGVIKWVGFVLLSGFVGIAVYQALFVTLFGTPSFPDAYGNPEAGIFRIKSPGGGTTITIDLTAL